MKRFLPFSIVGLALLLTIGAGALFFVSRQGVFPKGETRAIDGKPGAEPPHTRGPKTARVDLEEFGDFQCPGCAALQPVLRKLRYNGQIRLTFREFPLAVHPHAMDAARAAEAAGLQGRFWEMHDALYDNQWIWMRVPDPRPLFEQFAKTAGLDVARFKKDLESSQVKARITADQERGISLGANRTPVLLVNKRRIADSSLNEKGLERAIDTVVNAK